MRITDGTVAGELSKIHTLWEDSGLRLIQELSIQNNKVYIGSIIDVVKQFALHRIRVYFTTFTL